MRVQSGCISMLQSFEDLTETGGSASKVTHSQDWQVSAGCWQEVSAPHHTGPSTGLLECPCNMAAGFPRSK